MNAPALHGRAAPRTGAVRAGRFELQFHRVGARTAIGRQFVSYPFHMTRPFRLDRDIPELLTVYQQSSSGGLYRADELRSRIELGPSAAAHVTTQAATVVHDCQHQPARQQTELVLHERAFLAWTPDPLVLLPGALSHTVITARLAPGAVLFLADAFARHDPEGQDRPFEAVRSTVRIEDQSGGLLVREAYGISGAALSSPSSPVGAWKVVSSFLMLGDPARLPDRERIAAIIGADAVVGVSKLPNGCGWAVRSLSPDAVAARAFAETLFVLAVEAATGMPPAPRRK